MTSPGSEASEKGALSLAERRSAQGLICIGLGLLAILWGVFHVLNAIGGYPQRDFAHRKTDREVRTIVHEHFPGALVRGLAGVGLLFLGGRLRAQGRRERRNEDLEVEPSLGVEEPIAEQERTGGDASDPEQIRPNASAADGARKKRGS